MTSGARPAGAAAHGRAAAAVRRGRTTCFGSSMGVNRLPGRPAPTTRVRGFALKLRGMARNSHVRLDELADRPPPGGTRCSRSMPEAAGSCRRSGRRASREPSLRSTARRGWRPRCRMSWCGSEVGQPGRVALINRGRPVRRQRWLVRRLAEELGATDRYGRPSLTSAPDGCNGPLVSQRSPTVSRDCAGGRGPGATATRQPHRERTSPRGRELNLTPG